MNSKFVLNKRSLGILLHPSSLPNEDGCGTFGNDAKTWIKKLSENGIDYWQFLPLNPTDSKGSPYSSPSSFALNPLFLDITDLIEKGFISSSIRNLKLTNINSSYFDFAKIENLSKEIEEKLLSAWESQSEERKKEFQKWELKNNWLEDYSTFMVIREKFNMLPWWEWPDEYKQKNVNFLKYWKKGNEKAILKKKLVQWHLDEQWLCIKKLAKSEGITLIGDLPFYVSRDSADVWSNKSLFSVSQNGDLIFQSGVPPDYFSSTGQLWGTPTYFWSKHNRTNFKWWRERFRRQFQLVDILRLDHFRALAGYWRVNGKDNTAINGKWINSPGRKLLNILKKDLKTDSLPIIAEDLGVITPDVEKLRINFKLPGMKILQFAFDQNPTNPYLPENIEGSNWVVYTGTHDNKTSISWWECLEKDFRTQVNDYQKFSENASWNLIEIGMNTKANLFIAPIQDILSLDDSCRLNTPGTIENNWRWKLNKPLREIDLNLKNFSNLGRNYRRINK